MFHKYKELFADTIVYGVAGVLSAAIGFFLVPIYTSQIVPAEYGNLGLLITTQSLLYVIIIFGLDNSVATWYYLHPEAKSRAEAFYSWFVFSISFGFIVAVTLFLFAKKISAILLGTDSLYYLVQILSLNIFFTSIAKLPNILFRFQRRPKWAIAQSLGTSLFNVCFAILFVKFLKMGVQGALSALCISSFFGFVFCIFVLIRNFGRKVRLNFELLLSMIRFSLPLVPVSFLVWGQGSAMIYLLNMYLDKKEIGIYQISVSLSGVVSVATTAFFQAWAPFALAQHQEQDSKTLYANVMHGYALLGMVFVIGISLFSGLIFKWFTNPLYYSGSSILALLCFNAFLVGAPQVFSIVNNLSKNNIPLLKSYIIGCVFTLSTFLILIHHLQKEAAVYAMLIGNTVLCFYNYYQSQKLIHLPYKKILIGACYVVALTASAFIPRFLFQ